MILSDEKNSNLNIINHANLHHFDYFPIENLDEIDIVHQYHGLQVPNILMSYGSRMLINSMH